MNRSKATRVITEALLYRGFSRTEADLLITLSTEPVEEQPYIPVNKNATINVYA